MVGPFGILQSVIDGTEAFLGYSSGDSCRLQLVLGIGNHSLGLRVEPDIVVYGHTVGSKVHLCNLIAHLLNVALRPCSPFRIEFLGSDEMQLVLLLLKPIRHLAGKLAYDLGILVDSLMTLHLGLEDCAVAYVV